MRLRSNAETAKKVTGWLKGGNFWNPTIRAAMLCCLAIFPLGLLSGLSAQAAEPNALDKISGTSKVERARIASGGKAAIENAIKFKDNFKAYGQSSAENIERVMEGISGMAKLGKGLGMAGAGFGVLSGTLELFGVVESEAAENRRRLGEILSKIDTLDSAMSSRFDQLEARVHQLDKNTQLGIVKSQIFPYYNKLHSFSQQVDLYQSKRLTEEPEWGLLDALESGLAAKDANEIIEAVEAINSIVLGKRFAATNIFEAEYYATYGDMSRLLETAEMLTAIMNSAQFDYGLIKTIQLRRPKEKEQKLKANVTDPRDRVTHNLANTFLKPINYADVENIAKAANAQFGKIGIFAAISSQGRKYAKLGVEERGKNAKRYLEATYGGKGNLARKNPWNETAWGRQGDQSPEGFKRTLDKQMTARDYETKYGSLAETLKAKYLCDWFVMVYTPIQGQSGNAWTGMANQHNWNWYGTQSIWFLENENKEDYLSTDSALVFLVVSWSEYRDNNVFKPDARARTGYFDERSVKQVIDACSGGEVDTHLCINWERTAADESKQLYEDTKSFAEGLGQSGMAVQIRLPARLHALDKNWQHYYATAFNPVTFTPETAYSKETGNWGRPGVWKSWGQHTSDGIGGNSGIKGLNAQYYGSFFVNTTFPQQVTVINGLGRLVILYH